MNLEAKKALYIKNKKRRALIGYLFVSYVIVDLLVTLIVKFNIISGFSAYYEISTLYYVYGLGIFSPIAFFYVFNQFAFWQVMNKLLTLQTLKLEYC